MARRDRAPARTGLLVAVGVAAGLAVGAVVGGTAAPPPAPAPVAAEPSPPLPPPAVACVRAAELAEQVVDLAEDASRAMAELDARRLEELLDQMRDLDAELREQSRLCRATEEDGTPTED